MFSVLKDLANRCSCMTLLYTEASYWSWEGFYLNIWDEFNSILTRKIAVRKKSPPYFFFFNILNKLCLVHPSPSPPLILLSLKAPLNIKLCDNMY